MLPSPMKPIRSRCVAMKPPRGQGRRERIVAIFH
jgi:hypothetical protein